ncbi:hypothetical protein D3C79_656780 [compost metagenome]
MQGVVAVIVPLSVEHPFEQTRLIVLIFNCQPDVSTRRDAPTHTLAECMEKIRIINGVHRIQAQAVEAVVVQPHQCIFDKEVTHLAATKVDRRAPRDTPLLMKERACIVMEVIAVRAEVVVDHVQQYHQAMPVRLVNQLAQLVRGAIAVLRGEWQHAVIAPVAIPGELPDRHQFDRGNTQLGQGRQALDDPGIAAAQADVQLIDDRFVPGAAVPVRMLPAVGRLVHQLAGAVHAFGLVARCRVGDRLLSVNPVAVSATGLAGEAADEPAVGLCLQRFTRARFELDFNPLRVRCPEGKPGAATVQHRGPVGRLFL